MSEHLRAESVLSALLACMDDAVLTFTPDGIVRTWSSGAEKLYGYAGPEIIGKPLELLSLPNPFSGNQRCLDADMVRPSTHEYVARVHKNGSALRLLVRRCQLPGENGETLGILETARLISDMARDSQLRRLLGHVPVLLWTTDKRLRVTSHWGSAVPLAADSPADLVGRTVCDYLGCKDPDPYTTPVAEHLEALRGASAHFEYTQNARVYEVYLQPWRSEGGEIVGCLGTAIDLTERKQNEEQVRYQATHDALTGLANYRGFLDTLEREVKRAERSHHSFAVLLLDLDELKRINDRLGHLAGNRALKRLAESMKQHCRSTDLAARYGGDEFAVVLIDADPGMAQQIAGRVEAALQNDGEQPPISVSIGISVYPDDGRTAQELLEAADQHLYKRKRSSRSRTVTAT